MPTFGIGIDRVLIHRVDAAYQRWGDRFARRVLGQQLHLCHGTRAGAVAPLRFRGPPDLRGDRDRDLRADPAARRSARTDRFGGAERASSARGVQAGDRKSTRLNSSHIPLSRMPSSA